MTPASDTPPSLLVSDRSSATPQPPAWRERFRRRLTDQRSPSVAWALWAAFALGITIAVLISPTHRRTNGAYRTAAIAYLHSQPMYTPGNQGFLYPMQAAVLYVPFTFEPRILSEILWRLLGIAALGTGVWRLARATTPRGPPRVFLSLSLLVIPAALGAGRNGQMNLHLTALFAHGVVELIRQRWGMAAFWLCLAIAAKPIAVAPALLFVAVYPALWWRTVLGMLVVAALPFLHPGWSYVAEQYRAGLNKVIEAGEPGAGRFAELTSLIRLFASEPSYHVMTVIRAAAALLTLAATWLLTRRLDRPRAPIAALTLGTAYLMVFNPRTEGNTYVMLAPPLAVLAAWSIIGPWVRARDALLIVACVLLGTAHLFIPGQRDRWIRPSVALAVLVWLSAAAVSQRIRATIPEFQAESS